MNELIKLENDAYLLDTETAKKIAEFEILAKDIKAKQDELKEVIRAEMEAKNILSIKDEVQGIDIRYYPEQTDLEKFNKEEMRKMYPDIYDQFVTLDGKKKSYITIKIK